jgi:hypothetical protein
MKKKITGKVGYLRGHRHIPATTMVDKESYEHLSKLYLIGVTEDYLFDLEVDPEVVRYAVPAEIRRPQYNL